MAIFDSFLTYQRYRYLKVALAASLIAIVAYWAYVPIGLRNGGTWVGYTLGTLGFALILWLTFLGYRKRNYMHAATPLKAWVSAHVYLGLALLVIATLHTGFSFGVNIHTLAYILMVIVIVSGIYGVVAYARVPSLMTANRAGQSLTMMVREIAEQDRLITDAAQHLGDEVVAIIKTSLARTEIGGSAWRQIFGIGSECPVKAAIKSLEKTSIAAHSDAVEQLARLYAILRRKSALLDRVRRDIQLKAQMDVWLFVHVPISIALIAALVAHVVAVFFYW